MSILVRCDYSQNYRQKAANANGRPIIDSPLKIEQALQQQTFDSAIHKAHLNILVTASWLSQRTTRALKPFDISMQQYNILRILRGRHPESATVKMLTERMIDQTSNASRLVDKLVKKGLVERTQCPTDRRQVDITITEAGLEKLAAATQVVNEQIHSTTGNFSAEEAELVSVFLDKLRSRGEDAEE